MNEEWLKEAERLLTEYESDVRASEMSAAGFDRIGLRSHQKAAEETRAALMAHLARAAVPAVPGEAATARDAAFEEAMRQTWQMVDPIRPSGQPGSYNRGEYNGIIAALRTVRDNYERAKRAALSSTPGDGEQEVPRD